MIILASASPRRQDILKTAGYEFSIHPMDIDEENIHAATKEELVMQLALAKSRACRQSLDKLASDDYIIGADTLVFKDDRRLGKPANKEEWREYIKLLRNGMHEVITGVCILNNDKERVFYSTTIVTVDSMSDDDIDRYISLGEDMDKAGGYAIQGYFAKFISSIEGEYNNVVGFPIAAFRKEFDAFHNL